MKYPHLLAAVCAALALPGRAEIYKHVDAEGRVTYSNMPMKGAKRLDLGPTPKMIPAPSGSKSSGSAGSRSSASLPSPGDFPRVDAGTQKRRDQTKLQILRDEMASEQRLLDEARRQPPSPKSAESILFHQKNLEALQQEIARVR